MNLEDISALSASVMRERGIARTRAIGAFIDEHPHIPKEDILATSGLLGRCPFPSITGSPPVYKSRPYYDARRLETFNDSLIEPEDMI